MKMELRQKKTKNPVKQTKTSGQLGLKAFGPALQSFFF
jgi:hypothetical protein